MIEETLEELATLTIEGPDREALRETLEACMTAEALGLHCQDVWVCGARACFAGRRALLDGGIVNGDHTEIILPDGRRLPLYGYAGQSDWDQEKEWERWGARRFKITRLEARSLFHADNTMQDLKHRVDVICS